MASTFASSKKHTGHKEVAVQNTSEEPQLYLFQNGMYDPPEKVADEIKSNYTNVFEDDIGETRNRILNIEVAGRPTNFIYRMDKRNTAYWRLYELMEFYKREVSIVATIISRSVIELLRYNIDWKPKFVKKCANCGTEYQDSVKECDACGCKEFILPDEQQKDYFVNADGISFLDEANKSGQSLKSVIQSYAESQYQNNQGYIVCITGDLVNIETGKMVKSYPLEFLSIDPRFVRKSFDDTATPGKEYGFTLDDRGTAIPLSAHPDMVDERGEQIYPTHYIIGSNFGGTGEIWQYTKREVFCDNWFGQTLTYGVPIWMDIEDDVLTYHFIEKHQLKRWEYGYVRGLLVLPGFNAQSLEKLAKSIKAVLSKNDGSIPMIALPPVAPGAGEQKVQFISMTNDTAQDMLNYKNDIRDRLCGRAGVPNLIVTDTENSGGLNNDSQQITVFDRFLMDKYDRIDTMLKWFLSFFDKITDWVLVVGRPPKMNSDLKDKMDEAQYATQMKNLGFPPISQKNGKFEFPDTPQQPNSNPMGGMMGGGGGFPPSFR